MPPKTRSLCGTIEPTQKGDKSNISVCSEPDRSHDGREAPLGAEESVAVQAPPLVKVALQNVHPNHIWVHWVGVLPHGGLDDCLPWVTASK